MEDGKKSAIRIWACAMAFMGILLLWSRIVQAAPNDSNLSTLKDTIDNFYNLDINDNFFNQLSTLGYNSNDNYFLWLRKSSSYLQAYLYQTAVYDELTGYLNCTTPGYQVNYELRNGSVNYTTTTNWNVHIDNSTDQIIGYYNNVFLTDDIYDFTIPNFSGTFENPINDSISDPQICVGFRYSHGGGGRRRGDYVSDTSATPAPNRFLDYYVEIKGRFGICNQFNLSGTGSFLNWYPVNVDYTDYIDIYTVEDAKRVTDLGNNDFYLSLPDTIQEWTDLYDSNVETIVFNWNANITNTGKEYQEDRYKNHNMKLAGVQYNIADLYIRFVKMVDGEKHVGNWTHYVNSEVGTGTPPYNSIDDIPYVPSVDTSILDDDNVRDIIDNDGTDDTLLPSININTNFNAPQQNQLNYPTIVSFNHDSILTKIITTANQLPQFFEGFSNFLAAAFVFIDPSIWAIMGFGMMCSIVIMIIKVL